MRVYLDNAATSFPKPIEVYDAVDRYQRDLGAAYGRSSHRGAVEVQRIIDQCRRNVANVLGVAETRQIIFTFSGTDGLNLALFGLCRNGDHVVTTSFEHNSVIRPLRRLQETRNISVTVVEPRDNGMIDPVDVRASLRFNTRLVVINHASNVTGLIQPIADIGVVARQRGVLMIVDAAQSAGHVPIDFSQLPIDLLACPGHKGLLGPLGTGIVALRPGLEKVLDCYRFGGTGSFSEDDRQPEGLPDRYESGNMNVPGIVGLNSGLGFLFKETIPTLRSREIELTQRLIQGLQSCPSVTVYGHPVHGKRTDEDNWVGVVSFNFESIEPQEGASILDESFEIQSRAGLHCAPGVHRWLGTIDRGGTIRFSIGHFTTSDEIDRAIEAVRQIATA